MAPIARVLYFRFSRIRILDFIVRCLILLGIVAVAAALSGRLLLPDAQAGVVGCDFARALVLTLDASCSEVTFFPLVRDYASLFHVIMIAAMGTYGFVLIDGLKSFFDSATPKGVLRGPQPIDQRLIAGVSGARTNSIADIGLLLLGLGMCYVGTLGYNANGIYPAFALESKADDFALVAASSSWSSFPSLGYFVFLLVGGIGNYYILQIAVAAASALLIGVRAFLRGAFRLLPLGQDPRWGWSTVFDASRAGVVTSVFGLLGLLALLLRGGYENLPYLLLFPLIALGAVVPWFIINHIWGRAVDDTLIELGANAASNGSQGSLARMKYISVQLAPPRIVPLSASISQLIFTVIPGLVAFAQVSGLWG